MTTSTDSNPIDSEGTANLLDLLELLVANLRLLILGPLAAGLLVLGICFIVPPTYTATTRFLVPQGQSASSAMMQSLGALSGLAGAAGLKSPGDQFVSFVKSDSVQNALIDRFKLQERYDEKFRWDTRKELAKHSTISSNAKDGIVTVEVEDHESEFAANLANGHVQELQKLLSRLAITEAQQRRMFFEKLISNTKANWIKAEQALKATGVSTSNLKLSPATALEGVAKLRAAVTAQEIKIASMRGYLSDSAPDFRQAQTELAALKAQLSNLDRQDSESTSSNASAAQNDYIARYRDFKYNETLFELFSKQYEIARIDEGREGATIQVIDSAEPPERISRPRKGFVVVIAIILTNIILLTFVFLRRTFLTFKSDPVFLSKLNKLKSTWSRVIGGSVKLESKNLN